MWITNPQLTPHISTDMPQRAGTEYNFSYAENISYLPPSTSTHADEGFLMHRDSPDLSRPQFERIYS